MSNQLYQQSDELRDSVSQKIAQLNLEKRLRRQAEAAINNQWKGLRLHLACLEEMRYSFRAKLEELHCPDGDKGSVNYYLSGVRRHLHNLTNLPNIIQSGKSIFELMGSEVVMDYEELEKELT